MCLGNRVFFFNDTATTEICTLSLHDALPISAALRGARAMPLNLDRLLERRPVNPVDQRLGDRAERLVRDGVEAPLVAVAALLLAQLVVVELRGRHVERLAQAAGQRLAAAAQAAVAAVLARVGAPHAPTE